MRNMKKGFTLVELIVVVVILAILATIAFISLKDYPAKARDTKVKADVASIAKKITLLVAEAKVANAGELIDVSSSTPAGYDFNENSNQISTAENGSLQQKPINDVGTIASTQVKIGKINFTKFEEDPKTFQTPNKNDYKIWYVKGTKTVTGKDPENFDCFWVGGASDITSEVIQGDCYAYLTGKGVNAPGSDNANKYGELPK